MSGQVIEFSPRHTDPGIRCDRGVSFVPPADISLHAPDLSLLALDRGSLVARCSCWWRDCAPGFGVIGQYAAGDAESGAAVLGHACEVLAAAGCTTAVGPMDGNSWRRYRFIVERGSEPPFFLEPDNPDDWPHHWSLAGFSRCATYTSAVNDDLSTEDPRTSSSRARLTASDISIRTFDPARAEAELRRIFALSIVAFSRNLYYTSIPEQEFLAQNYALLPFVRPELILLAEREEALVGFMFAMPDLLQAQRGASPDTVILKTIAVDPSVSGIGLGGVLMDLVQRRARQMGFRRAIHALMHETNGSRRISDRYARTIRRYALFSRPLDRSAPPSKSASGAEWATGPT